MTPIKPPEYRPGGIQTYTNPQRLLPPLTYLVILHTQRTFLLSSRLLVLSVTGAVLFPRSRILIIESARERRLCGSHIKLKHQDIFGGGLYLLPIVSL